MTDCEFHIARHDAPSVAHIAPNVPPAHVDRHLIVQVSALAPDHRWARAELNVRHLPERHLRAVTAADQEPADRGGVIPEVTGIAQDRKSTRLNSSHTVISYAVFCLKKKKNKKLLAISIDI